MRHGGGGRPKGAKRSRWASLRALTGIESRDEERKPCLAKRGRERRSRARRSVASRCQRRPFTALEVRLPSRQRMLPRKPGQMAVSARNFNTASQAPVFWPAGFTPPPKLYAASELRLCSGGSASVLPSSTETEHFISKMLYLREELPARLTMEEITTSEYMLPASAARIVAFLATQLTGTISPYPTVRMVM